MKHCLTVKIEKRFKKQLSKRFNPRNAENTDSIWLKPEKRINVSCCLCDEYWCGGNEISCCGDCPFYIFETNKRGCLQWILRIVGKRWSKVFIMGSECIEWDKENNKQATELLKKLREKAKEYIVWVENTE